MDDVPRRVEDRDDRDDPQELHDPKEPDRPRPDRRRVVVALLVALLAALGLYQAHWVFSERADFRMQIDEAAYFGDAVGATERVTAKDPGEVMSYYFAEDHQTAPLLSVLSVPLLIDGRMNLRWGLLGLVAVSTALLAVTYLVARRVVGDPWSLLAVAIVGCTPGIVDYGRTFHLALLATATFTAALWALLATERFTRPWAALGWGALVGLTLLSRTMMVALVPGLVLAGLIAAVGPGAGRARRRAAAWFGAGLAAAAVVAVPWWAANWSAVSGYLTGYGYGGDGSSYGPRYSPLDPLYYLRIPYRIALELYEPLAILVLVGLVLAAGRSLGLGRQLGLRAFTRRGIDRGHLLVAVVVVSGAVALMSSRNRGTGFVLPLIPAVVVLAVWGIARLRLPAVRWALTGLVALVLLADVAMKSPWVPALAEVRQASPVTSEPPLPITDGRSLLDAYLEPTPYPANADVAPVIEQALDRVDELAAGGPRPFLGVQAGDYLLNPASVDVARAVRFDETVVWPVSPDHPGTAGDPVSRADQRDLLEGEVPDGMAQFLLTIDLEPEPASLPTSVDTAGLEQAASDLGFVVVDRYQLPSGLEARLWQLPASG